jgi:hypothetical protein
MTIPASELVQVIPNVLSAGGNPLSLNSIFLTQSTRVPIGSVASFSTLADVEDFFGPTSQEATLAGVYFNGFNGCTQLPGVLYLVQYNTAAVAGYLRSGSFAGVTLSQLQTLSGTLILSVDGSLITTGSINLAGATSFTNAAVLIQTGINAITPGAVAVTYDSQLSRFVIASATTGVNSIVTVATGTLSTGLKVTTATGAVTSAGAAIATPAGTLGAVNVITQNWVSFLTCWEPVTADKLLFAAWVQTQGQRYLYIAWDSDITVTQGDAPSSFGAQVLAAEDDGVFVVYDTDGKKAAFIAGTTASIDFARTNGRITFAFKAQSGLTADVTNASAAGYLKTNGYSYYADYATANDSFQFLQDGSIAGKWNWLDSYVNQIALNNALQLAYMDYLSQALSVPYNTTGYSQLRAVALDPILSALNFGSIRPGVTLSNSQKAQVNSAAGADISDTLYTAGWYLGIRDPGAVIRGQRGSPVMVLFYMDGGSVQRITISSTNVQ